MENLQEIKRQLKLKMPTEGITYVLKQLKGLLPDSSPRFDALIQIEAAYRDVKQQMLEGVIKQEDISHENAKIRQRLLDFIDELEPDDFSTETKTSELTDEKIRKGHVLYQIPNTMQLGIEARCLVRIAFDKVMLVEDLDIDENTEFRTDVRISDYMRVEIIDPNANPAFEIRTTSQPVQFIDQDDYTEWRFYVKPLLVGEHILEVKVMVIVKIDGEDHVREKTLEEPVVIITEAVSDEEPAFKQMEETLYSGGSTPLDAEEASRAAVNRGSKGPSRIGRLQGYAMGLLGVLAFSTASYALIPGVSQGVDWTVANNIRGTEKAYTAFIDKYEDKAPSSKRLEKAYYLKARVQDDPAALREFIAEHPRSKFREEARWEITQITKDPADYLAYVTEYDRAERVKQAKQQILQKEDQLLEKVNARDQESRQLLEKYIEVFPEKSTSTKVRRKANDIGLNIDRRGNLIDIPDPGRTESPQLPANPERLIDSSQIRERNPDFSDGPQIDGSIRDAIRDDGQIIDNIDNRAILNNLNDRLTTNTENTAADLPRLDLPKMARLEGGAFVMGDVFGDGDYNEFKHEVKLSPFQISVFELTFAEYDQYCAETGAPKPEDEGWGRGKRPVINVSWLDAISYCNWRSIRSGLDPVYQIEDRRIQADWSANGFRLPTEAEWEFAARSGGKPEKWAGTNQESRLDRYANADKELEKTAPVGSYAPNGQGLYDMTGNVLEWCWDWYDSSYYLESEDTRNPRGPQRGRERICRGGSWGNGPELSRTTSRFYGRPLAISSTRGFRLARNAR